MLVEEPGDLGVHEALALHDVAPVARAVADREEDRLVLGLGPGERLGPPRDTSRRGYGRGAAGKGWSPWPAGWPAPACRPRRPGPSQGQRRDRAGSPRRSASDRAARHAPPRPERLSIGASLRPAQGDGDVGGGPGSFPGPGSVHPSPPIGPHDCTQKPDENQPRGREPRTKDAGILIPDSRIQDARC